MDTVASCLSSWMAQMALLDCDCDNGGELIGYTLIASAAKQEVCMTRSGHTSSTTTSHVEQENGNIVRKAPFRYCCDT